MDITTLKVFLCLADNLHFARTGEVMHMSPSAVSRTIKRLEQELGETLFERDNRSVRLTEAGRLFVNYADKAIADWQAINQQFSSGSTKVAGELSVYCSVTAVYGVLANIFETLRDRYPAIEIKLHTGDQAQALERVLSSKEDIAIAARPEKLSSRLNFQTLLYSPLVFICPAIQCGINSQVKSYENNLEPLLWDELPFIVSEYGEAKFRLEEWFEQQHISPKVYAQVSGNEAIVSMVALGLGLALVPELVLSNSPMKDKVRVLNVQPPLNPFAVGICCLSKRFSTPLIQAFWECAESTYQLN